MQESDSIISRFQKRVLSSQAGMWVALGVLIGISAGVGSLLLYNGIRFFSYLLLQGISGFQPPIPGGEGGSLAYSIGSVNRYLIPVSTTIGGFVSGFLVYKLIPGSEGLGINSAIKAFHNLSVKIKNRTPAVKLVASAVNIGAGGSAGRDGPVALISAVFGSYLSDMFRLDDHDRRILMASAIGAGIGSIFMAPIGGAIMSTEILYRRDFEVEALIPATVASVVGYAIFGFQFHYQPLFTTVASTFLFADFRSILLYLAIGLLAGLGGRFYVTVFDLVHLAFIRMRHLPVYVKPTIGGLIVGAIAIFYPQVLGLGYGWVQLILAGNLEYMPITVLIILFFAKIMATSFSLGSGGAGGAFAPSIVTGAFLGAILGLLIHPVFQFVTVDEVTIVTMISFFAGVSKTPVSMLIMGTEMAGGLQLFLPLLIAIPIAYFVSGAGESIYNEQVLNRLHSPAHIYEYDRGILKGVSVREAMNREYIEVEPSTEIWDVIFRMRVKRLTGVVVAENGQVRGYLSRNEIDRAGGYSHRPVSDIPLQEYLSIDDQKSIGDALEMLPRDMEENIIVRGTAGETVGTIGFRDIANAYEDNYRKAKIGRMSGK